jgi:hypothetical protein
VGLWWYTVRYFRGALLDGAATTFLFLVSLWARMASSAVMTLLMNSENVPPMLSAMRSCSLMERPIMKRSFFSSMSTWSGAYCARWLNYVGYVQALGPCMSAWAACEHVGRPGRKRWAEPKETVTFSIYSN